MVEVVVGELGLLALVGVVVGGVVGVGEVVVVVEVGVIVHSRGCGIDRFGGGGGCPSSLLLAPLKVQAPNFLSSCLLVGHGAGCVRRVVVGGGNGGGWGVGFGGGHGRRCCFGGCSGFLLPAL